MILNRYVLFLLLVLILFPQLALADVAFALFRDTLPPALLLIIPFEIFVFQYVFNKLFFYTNIVKKKINVIKAIIIVICANIVSYCFGVLIETVFKAPHISHQSAIGQGLTLGVAFLLSALLEWIVYIPFFLQTTGNSKKRSSLLKVSIITNLIPYLLLAILILPNFHPKPSCTQTESDANTVAAAIADYFSDPNHTATPTFDQLKNWTSVTLSGKNTATIMGADPNVNITITVTDASGRCPKDYQGASADWDGNDVYTLTITQ